MNERDLRNAFDHLKRDVIMSVQTEERLEQVTGRRVWFSPAITAFAGAAALALIVGGAILALRPTDPDPVAPATTVTTLTETTAPPTTVAPSPNALPDLPAGTVLVGVPGADTTASAGVVVVDGRTAIGDGAGGVVLQRDDAILHIAPDGAETLVLDAQSLVDSLGPVTIRLQDVTEVNGSPQTIVIVGYGQEYPDVFQEVWLVDIETGAAESVYQLVAVESNITRVSSTAGRMVLSVSFEGGSYFEYLDMTGAPLDVTGPFYNSPLGNAWAPQFIDQAVLSPDGSMFVYIEVDYSEFDDGAGTAALVSWDLESGTELGRREIELSDDARHGRMDYDGTSVVIGRYQDAAGGIVLMSPLQLASLEAGNVTELDPAGSPSLVK